MKWTYTMIVSAILLGACTTIPPVNVAPTVQSDVFLFEAAGIVRIDLQDFAVPSMQECNNPAAHNWYEHAMDIEGIGRDKMFTLVHAAWLGLCSKMDRRDITRLEAITAFDHLLQSFDAARFLVEPFHSVSGKRES